MKKERDEVRGTTNATTRAVGKVRCGQSVKARTLNKSDRGRKLRQNTKRKKRTRDLPDN